MHILNIGNQMQAWQHIKVKSASIFSPDMILDADMIFWNVSSTYSNMSGNPTRTNPIAPNLKDQYLKGLQQRDKEFKEFFDLGRILVITSPAHHKYKYQVVDGPLASANKGELDIWDCLPILRPYCSKNNSQNIEGIDNPLIDKFLNKFKDNLNCRFRIDKSDGNPLFYIKGTKYVVGEYYKVGNGIIMIIPDFSLRQAKDIETFTFSISEISKGLLKIERQKAIEFPGLVFNYSTNGELKVDAEIKVLEEKKQKILDEILRKNQILDDINHSKLLFAGDGDPLEDVCKRVFESFGFKILDSENNRDDLIIKIKNKVAVVEIKGVTKSAGEKHAAQLQKWVSDYHANNGNNPKGILIVNTFKNIPIENRHEKDFPEQMMKYVNQMEHCVVSGLQLFAIYEDFKAKKITKEKVIDLLFNTIGEINYTSEFEKYLILKSED